MSMDSALTRFQDGFTQALLAPVADDDAGLTPEIAALARQPGFAVYRNTVMKGCIDALQANYPSVARLVGEEWFRAAATMFARERLPAQATLMYYGDAFAEFLAGKPGLRLALQGHADERGSREYNLALGERRAMAVQRLMVLLGAGAGQLSSMSYGEEKPVAYGHDEGSWSLNRRVELVY